MIDIWHRQCWYWYIHFDMVFTITLGKWFRHGQLSLGGLFKSFNLDLIIFLTNNTFFIRHCFTTLFDKYIYKLILLSYSFNLTLLFHISSTLSSLFKWFIKQNMLQGSWLTLLNNPFLKPKSWILFSQNLCYSLAFLC